MIVGCNADTLAVVLQSMTQIVQNTLTASSSQSTCNDNADSTGDAGDLNYAEDFYIFDNEVLESQYILENDENIDDIAVCSTNNMATYTNAGKDTFTSTIPAASSIDDADIDEYYVNDSGIDEASTRASSPEIEQNTTVKRRNNKRPVWYDLITFTNVDDYDAYMKRENFSTDKTDETLKVTNRYMRCKLVKKSGEQCAARLCVRMSKIEVTWVVQTNGLEHTHEKINNKVAPKVRDRVAQMRRQLIPPRKAQALAEEEFGEDAPSIHQIYHLNRMEDAQKKTSFSTIGELVECLQAHTA